MPLLKVWGESLETAAVWIAMAVNTKPRLRLELVQSWHGLLSPHYSGRHDPVFVDSSKISGLLAAPNLHSLELVLQRLPFGQV